MCISDHKNTKSCYYDDLLLNQSSAANDMTIERDQFSLVLVGDLHPKFPSGADMKGW